MPYHPPRPAYSTCDQCGADTKPALHHDPLWRIQNGVPLDEDVLCMDCEIKNVVRSAFERFSERYTDELAAAQKDKS